MVNLLISGASGLVGKIALWQALDDDRVGHVLCLCRRPLPIKHPKLEQRIIAFAPPLDPLPPVLGQFDAALCSLGTTMRAAGSHAAFRMVDYEAVLSFAGIARMAGVRRFALVSSAGADPAARNFYLSVKGEAEQDLAQMGFQTLTLLRPGLIIGARAERRPAEKLAQMLMPRLIDPLLQGAWRRYRSIPARAVAQALLTAVLDDMPGGVLEHDAILALAHRHATAER